MMMMIRMIDYNHVADDVLQPGWSAVLVGLHGLRVSRQGRCAAFPRTGSSRCILLTIIKIIMLKVDLVKQLVSFYPDDLAWATTADQIDQAFASGECVGFR